MVDWYTILTLIVVTATVQGGIFRGSENDDGDLIMPSYGTLLRKHSLVIGTYQSSLLNTIFNVFSIIVNKYEMLSVQ